MLVYSVKTTRSKTDRRITSTEKWNYSSSIKQIIIIKKKKTYDISPGALQYL